MGGFIGNADVDWSVSVGTAGGNREDLSDVIINIHRKETPLLSSLKRAPNATATSHEWMVDILTQPTAVEATAEVSDATFAATTDPVRLLNYTHIMRKTLEISDTQEAVRKAGRASEIQYRQLRVFKELARQTEYNLWYSTSNAQTQAGNALASPADDARRMAGVREYQQDNPVGQSLTASYEGVETDPAGSPRTYLSEIILNAHLQSVWDNHGKPDTIWVNAVQKRTLSTFTAGSTKNFDAVSKKVVNVVDVYESDFGMMSIHLHDLLEDTELYTLQMEYWALAWLEGTKSEVLARVGNTTKIMVEHQLTLEALAPNSSGYIKALANAFSTDTSAEGTAPSY